MNGFLIFAHGLDLSEDQWRAIEKNLEQTVEQRTGMLYFASAICLIEFIVIIILITTLILRRRKNK